MTKAEHPFLTRIRNGRPVTADGAMGTFINQELDGFTGCFDELNLTEPYTITRIHRRYIEAGAELIKTNTFGANRYKLGAHGLGDKLAEINQAGVAAVRTAIHQAGSTNFIAGDIGPLGVRIAPFGRIQRETAREAFAEQMKALAEGGVDLLLVETITDVYELQDAIQAAVDAVPHLPLIASMTFTRDDRTLLGDNPAHVARELHQAGADVIGINCSGGPNQILRLLNEMVQAVPGALFSVMPNAGWPEQSGGRILYPAGAQYFGDYAQLYCAAGARIVGGCCGTTPDHIRAVARALQRTPPEGCAPVVEFTGGEEISRAAPPAEKSKLAAAIEAGKFVVTVEMDPPRGLTTQKIIAGASLLAEAGATAINVADSPMARMRMSPWAVCNLIQRQVGIETVLHFPTRGRNLLRVQGDLLAAHALDIHNVFVVMGDPTAIGDYPNAMDNYDVVPSGLIQLIKQQFNAGRDQAGTAIGTPTGFHVGAALNLTPRDTKAEVKNFRRKIDKGADFFLTQPVYDAAAVTTFLDMLPEAAGIEQLPPILVGIMPLANERHARFLNQEVPGIEIPQGMIDHLSAAGDQSPREGVRLAIDMIEKMRSKVHGAYLMPAFGRYDHIAEIIDVIVAG